MTVECGAFPAAPEGTAVIPGFLCLEDTAIRDLGTADLQSSDVLTYEYRTSRTDISEAVTVSSVTVRPYCSPERLVCSAVRQIRGASFEGTVITTCNNNCACPAGNERNPAGTRYTLLFARSFSGENFSGQPVFVCAPKGPDSCVPLLEGNPTSAEFNQCFRDARA